MSRKEDELIRMEEQRPLAGASADSTAASTAASERRKVEMVVLAVGFYWVVSISLVFLNKIVLVPSNFPFPFFVTWAQLVIALLFIFVLGPIGRRVEMLNFLPSWEFDLEIAKRVFPLTIIYVSMLATTNICLMKVEVSFYQLVRSLTVVFSIGIQWFVLGIPSSRNVILAACGTVGSFVIGSIGEVNFSWPGVIAGLFSGAIMSYYTTFVQKVMPAVDGNAWRLMIYNTAMSVVLLFPIMAVTGELAGLSESSELYAVHAWVNVFMTGVFGYLINIAIFLQVKATSPLTSSISGNVKAILQTFLAVVFFGTPITFLNFVGLSGSIVFSAWYSWIKLNEPKK